MTWPVTPNPGIHTHSETSNAGATNSLTGIWNAISRLPLMIIQGILAAVTGIVSEIPFVGPLLAGPLTSLENVFTNLLGNTLGITNPSALTQSPGTFDLSSVLGEIPLLGPLISTFTGFLSGGSSSSTSLGGLSSLLNNIPLIGPLISVLTGGNVDPASGLAGLGSFFNWIPGYSDVVSMIHGIVSSIPIVGPLIDTFLTFLTGAPSSGGTTSDLAGALGNIPLIGPLLEIFTGSTSTGAGSGQDLLGGIFGDIMGFLGFDTGSGLGTGSADTNTAATNMLQNNLTPAGALTTSTPIPPHVLGALTSGANASANVLPDPGFDDPATLSGQGIWMADRTVGRTVLSSVVGSVKTTADGTLRSLVGVPISAKGGDPITLGAFAKWTGVSATTGNAIILTAQSYDSDGNQLTDDGHLAAAITTPGTDSSTYPDAETGGWVKMTGGYNAPTGTVYVRLVLQVNAVINSGSIWFDDCSLQVASLVDATLLGNFENVAAGSLPAGMMSGAEGILTVLDSFSHLFDGLGSAFSLSSQSGVSFSDLFGIAQTGAQDANSALTLGAANSNVLNIRNNQPTGGGANNTTEAMVPLAHFGSAGAVTTTSVAAGTSLMHVFRPGQVAKKGFVEFLGQNPSSVTSLFMNILKWNGTSWDKVYGSTDISSLVPTGGVGIVRVPIPSGSQPTMNAGEQYMFEVVNNSASAITVATKNTGVPNNGNETIANLAASRTLSSSGGSAPSNLANSAVTYHGNVPFFGAGVLSVPANYLPPVLNQYTSNATWTRAAGFTTGDLVDAFVLGAGGGGGSGGYGAWQSGGGAGQWATQTFVLDSDIRSTGYPVLALTTSLAVVIGNGGSGGANPFLLQPGNAGGASTVSGTGITTLTGAGGLGGGNGYTGSGTGGQGAGSRTIADYTAYGGADVGINSSASPPGGGGGSGYPAFGNDGAPGKVWIRCRQGS